MFKFSLRQLEYFVQVAESGSLAVAARRLHISQPSVSNAISKLEDNLNIALFVRHHAQGVSLTSAGGRMLSDVKALLAHADDVQENAFGLGNQVRGRLHLGCFGPIASRYIPALVTQFNKVYPDVELKLYEENSDTLITGLEANRYDLAIMYQLDLPATLTMETLTSLTPYALLPTNHPLVRSRKVKLKQLAKHSMVLLDLPRSREYFTTLFEARGLQPQISMRSPSFETVRALVANGAGFSILVTRPNPSICYDGKAVVEVEISDSIAATEIVLVHHGKSRPTRLLSTFIDYCKSNFENC